MSDHPYNSPPGTGTPPQHGEPSRDGWILQQLNNVSRETAAMNALMLSMKDSMKRMEDATDRSTNQIHRIQILLACATTAVVIIGGGIGFLVERRFDQIIELIAK